MNFSGSSRPLILVHRAMKTVTGIEGRVDVMVTPQFYTVKREALHIRFAHQAQKIAPSLFDGLLEDPANHDYFVYREDETWVFIAYDPKEIAAFLESRGIAPQQVAKLFFAQQAKAHFTAPVALGEREALVLIDQTVTVVPRAVLHEQQWRTFDETFRPGKGVSLGAAETSLLTRKQALSLAAILFLFGIIWLSEGWRYGRTNTALQTKLEIYYATYPSLQSAYTRDSIAAKYRKIDKIERKKRQVVGKIAGMLFKGVTLKSFEMDEKGFHAVFEAVDAKTLKRLEALAKASGIVQKQRKTGTTMTIEGKV